MGLKVKAAGHTCLEGGQEATEKNINTTWLASCQPDCRFAVIEGKRMDVNTLKCKVTLMTGKVSMALLSDWWCTVANVKCCCVDVHLCSCTADLDDIVRGDRNHTEGKRQLTRLLTLQNQRWWCEQMIVGHWLNSEHNWFREEGHEWFTFASDALNDRR